MFLIDFEFFSFYIVINNGHFFLDPVETASRDQDRGRLQSVLAHPPRKFRIISQAVGAFNKFGARKHDMVVQIENPPSNVSSIEWLESAVSQLYLHIKSMFNDTDKVGITFTADTFRLGAGIMSFRYLYNINPGDIWALIFNITQSIVDFEINDSFKISVFGIRMPSGQGRPPGSVIDLVTKKSIIRILDINYDPDDVRNKICLPRAIVVAMAHFERNFGVEEKRHYNRVGKTDRYRNQIYYAEVLLNQVGLPLKQNGYNLEDLAVFQRHLKGQKYAIMVYESCNIGTGEPPLFNGVEFYKTDEVNPSFADDLKIIKLLYIESINHFEVITNLTALAALSYYCERCNKTFSNKKSHKCPGQCSRCFSKDGCDGSSKLLKCVTCLRWFSGKKCLNHHVKKGSFNRNKSICEVIMRCPKCNRQYDIWNVHECGKMYCRICKGINPLKHLCYMKPVTNQSKLHKYITVYIFYDFETTQHEQFQGSDKIFEHHVNYGVAQKVCTKCLDKKFGFENCQFCAGCKSEIFNGGEVVDNFLEFVFAVERLKGVGQVICIGHNAKSFDLHFILKRLLKNSLLSSKPDLILTGTKIMLLKLNKIKFVCSLNYLPMKLTDLPKAFGLNPDLSKGYFPHYFNTPDNQTSTNVPLPDKKYYGVDSMSVSDREKFDRWYNDLANKNIKFNFQAEMEKYCTMDVTILREAALKFRKIFLEMGQIDPFLEACTMASACSLLYRKKYLKENMIGIIPPRGYRKVDNHSKIALKWLCYEEKKIEPEKIISAARGREHYIQSLGIHVDGYRENGSEKHVYQFHGCYFHKHTCYRG